MSTSDRGRFVFEGAGSRGDIIPLLTLCRQMCARGHACTVIAPEPFRDEVLALGADFVMNTTRRTHFQSGDSLAFEGYFFPGLETVADYFAAALHDEPRTVVVNIDRTCASKLLAEKHGLTTVRLHLSPFQIRSLTEPAPDFLLAREVGRRVTNRGSTRPGRRGPPACRVESLDHERRHC